MLGEIRIKNICFILIGAAVFSFGLVHFNMQNNLAEGGFTGITLLLYALFHISPSISNLVLNIPIFFIGWRMLGRTMFVYTLIGTVSLSVFLSVFQRWPPCSPVYLSARVSALFLNTAARRAGSISSPG
jgi:uncharacterized membrane-anchored protein YitT (DUF2179 family)